MATDIVLDNFTGSWLIGKGNASSLSRHVQKPETYYDLIPLSVKEICLFPYNLS
jgi:hypothetical protein